MTTKLMFYDKYSRVGLPPRKHYLDVRQAIDHSTSYAAAALQLGSERCGVVETTEAMARATASKLATLVARLHADGVLSDESVIALVAGTLEAEHVDVDTKPQPQA